MQAINQQTQQGQFRLDVTFKVLFSLYIQYTSQKYTVNLQRRATRYTREKSASCGGGRFCLMKIIKRESMFVLFWIFFFFKFLKSVHAFTSCTDVTVEATLKKDGLNRGGAKLFYLRSLSHPINIDDTLQDAKYWLNLTSLLLTRDTSGFLYSLQTYRTQTNR